MSGIKHAFVSSKSDGSDTSKLRPSDWNAKHDIIMGNSDSTAEAIGRANINITSVGTDADTVEKTLMSYSLPANALSANGNAVRIRASGKFRANINWKTLKLYFGSTIVLNQASQLSGKAWKINIIAYRIGIGNQLSKISFIQDSTIIVNSFISPVEDETGIIIIKITGQNGTASLNDIIFKESFIEIIE